MSTEPAMQQGSSPLNERRWRWDDPWDEAWDRWKRGRQFLRWRKRHASKKVRQEARRTIRAAAQ